MTRCDLQARARAAVRRALAKPDRPEAPAPAVVTDARGRVIAHIHTDPVTGERTRVEKRKRKR